MLKCNDPSCRACGEPLPPVVLAQRIAAATSTVKTGRSSPIAVALIVGVIIALGKVIGAIIIAYF